MFKTHRGWMIIIVLLLGWGAQARSQEAMVSADTLELTLDKAIELALTDNPTIHIANKEIQRVDYAKREAWSSIFPSISADGSYTRNMKLQVLFLPDGIFGPGTGGAQEMGFKNSFTGSLTASMPLFSYSLFQNIKISEHEVKAAFESARANRINMEAEVRSAYYGLLLANDSYAVMQKSIENAEENLTNVQNMFSQGVVAEYDVIRSEVQVRNLRPSLVQAENGVRLSEMMLRVLLGVGQDIEIRVTEELFDFEKGLGAAIAPGDVDLSGNTDLVQMELQLDKMQTQYNLVRSQRYPNLVGFINYQAVSQANDFKFADYQWANPFSMGLQLSIPIFNGFSIHYQEKQVAIGMEQMHMQREYMERNLTLQMRNAYTNMIKALEQIDSNREGVKQAERGFSIAQTRYNTGSGTFLELNDAEIALTQAKLNLNQAMYDYLSAETEYRKIMGQELQSIDR